jgi:6-pyruvoyltetrahydropterin/6-carboxytetrahydropterin synthase
MIVVKEFSFSAAHQLSKVHDCHKCRNLHGHNYRVRIECTSETLDHRDMVVDFDDIKEVVKPLIEMLDHHNINDVVGYDNTTSEWMCNWFTQQIANRIPLSAVEVWETPTCGARLEITIEKTHE